MSALSPPTNDGGSSELPLGPDIPPLAEEGVRGRGGPRRKFCEIEFVARATGEGHSGGGRSTAISPHSYLQPPPKAPLPATTAIEAKVEPPVAAPFPSEEPAISTEPPRLSACWLGVQKDGGEGEDEKPPLLPLALEACELDGGCTKLGTGGA